MIFTEAPPLSAFADFNLENIQKQKANSVNYFYNILFTEKKTDDNELHAVYKESIKGSELKLLYEQYCYLNGYKELSLSDPYNINLLSEKGFKFIEKVDGQT